MSLINPRNFVAPLKNKVQVGTVLVLALVIAFVRMVSGGGSVEPRESLKVNDSIKEFLKSQEPKTAIKEKAITQEPFETSINVDELDAFNREARRVPPKQESDDSHKGLSDVRRMVGLE